MSNLLKKIVISLLTFLVVFTSIAPNFLSVKAQSASPAPTGTWYNQDFKSWWTKVYDNNVSPDNEIFGERYTAAQVQWVIYSLWAFVFNIVVPSGCGLGEVVDLSACASAVEGLLSAQSDSINIASPPESKNMLSLIFAADRPLSGIAYVKEKTNRFSLTPEVHAQSAGFGFTNALQPVQDLWRQFRNIAYGLFVITAIVFSFMIMFRVKISPQVVISVQSAIPKLIIALILVTFSYAIAGFLVDFMYVVIGLVSLSFGNALGATWVFNFLTVGQPLGGVQVGILALIGGYFVVLFIGLVILLFTSSGLVGAVGTLLIIPMLTVLFIIVAVIVGLWIAIKTVWALLKAFANVLLLVIFAPLQLSLGILVPNFGFGAWVKSFLAALSTFVVTGVLILLSYLFAAKGIFIGMAAVPGGDNLSTSLLRFFMGDNGIKIAGVVGQASSTAAWPPLLGSTGTGAGLLLLAVSFVIFTLIPKSVEIVQGFITGKPFAYGSAIGEAFGPITGPVGFGADIAKSFGRDFATGFIKPGQRGRALRRDLNERATQNVRPGEAPSGRT